MSDVRLRFAPSPTGELHLGSALVAVANLAFARAEGGTLVLRIDDTDMTRSHERHVASLLDDLAWLGFAWDEGPVRQADRRALYDARADELLDRDRAYRCFCTNERLDELHARQRAAGQPPRYDGRCRQIDPAESAARADAGEDHVLRLHVPARDFDLDDAVRGRVAAPTGSFGDFIIRRADGSFGYQFATVCDEIDLRITHVLRGDDHLPNTPRQLAIFDALGASPPRYAHLPLLMYAGRKLSKRDPAGTLGELRRFLPGSIRRYLMELLGQGAVDVDAGLDLARVPRSAPSVSIERLRSIERARASELGDDELGGAIAPVVRDLLPEADSLADAIATSREVLARPAAPAVQGVSWPLDELERLLAAHPGDMHAVVGGLKAAARDRGEGVGAALKPVRLALTGRGRGPHLEALLEALGSDEILARVAAARGPE